MPLLLTLNIFHTFVLVFLLLTLNMKLPAGKRVYKVLRLPLPDEEKPSKALRTWKITRIYI